VGTARRKGGSQLQGETRRGRGFYLLYDKICREDLLVHAYRLARVNAGASGVEGMTFARIEEPGLEVWLAGLRAELVSKT
jgi:RNA-directed DNA polymerase